MRARDCHRRWSPKSDKIHKIDKIDPSHLVSQSWYPDELLGSLTHAITEILIFFWVIVNNFERAFDWYTVCLVLFFWSILSTSFLALQEPKSPNFLRSRLQRSRNCLRIIFGGKRGKKTPLLGWCVWDTCSFYTFPCFFCHVSISISESQEAPIDTFASNTFVHWGRRRSSFPSRGWTLSCPCAAKEFEAIGLRALYVYHSRARSTSNAYLWILPYYSSVEPSNRESNVLS